MMVKIMVVDDMDNTLELVKAILGMEGYSVQAFNDAEKALDYIKKCKKNPDLLLLDMRMPNMSGQEFCGKLRKDEKTKDLKVVFFTASSDVQPDLLKETGALGFLFKPFQNDKLVKEIKGYLSK